MSILTNIERQKLELEFDMPSGFVLAFSNRTFEEFFRHELSIEIYSDIYNYKSGSKANRMRKFWDLASTQQIIRLLEALHEGWEIYAEKEISSKSEKLLSQILARLSGTKISKSEALALSEVTAQKLSIDLVEVSKLLPQRRGFAFERFLKDLFDANGLSARNAFRIVGEQIDGSFQLLGETYLLEAKWQNERTGNADLHTFQGKVGEKASWTRGLFISYSGFTEEGLSAFGRGKSIVCMDGFDFSEMLRLQLSMKEVVEAKTRKASETGAVYTPVRDLFQ